MSDTAETNEVTEIESRLARALDRIAAGLAAVPVDKPAEAETALQDAEGRAAEAIERVMALEARLAETQDTLAETQDALGEAQAEVTNIRTSAGAAATAALAEADAAVAAMRAEAEAAVATAEAGADEVAQAPGSNAAALAALEQKLAATEASRGAAQAELAERAEELSGKADELAEKDAALAELQAALDAAQTPDAAVSGAAASGEPDAEPEDIEKALAVMGHRVERARIERDQARAACDAATDALDELREATGVTVDDRVLVLRRQLRLMRGRAEDLAAQVSLLQSGAGVDASVLDQGLLAEVETLRQLRETDAAELDRILQEMQAGIDMAGSDIDERGSHA